MRSARTPVVQYLVSFDFHAERIAPADLADVFAHRLGCEKRIDALLPPVNEEIGETSVEGLLGIDLEIVLAMPF